MPEQSLEQVIQEKEFVALLEGRSYGFLRLSNSLLSRSSADWRKKHFYQLLSEAEDLESFLDDYGARYNRTFSYLREVVASVRWFAQSGFSLAHLEGRFDSYGVTASFSEEELDGALESVRHARAFVGESCVRLLSAFQNEADSRGLNVTRDTSTVMDLTEPAVRHQLPRNVGQEDLVDEEQKIAEVASKFLSATAMIEELGIRKIEDSKDRRRFLGQVCTEEHARVYEATVHNLQSTYDTYIKNTVLEGNDDRLPRLRGHVSVTLHLLETITFLTHFVERHESGVRSEEAENQLAALIDRGAVQSVILNDLAYWADQIMTRGRSLAEDLLPSYTNVQELLVELPDDIKLHARPAALIVGIVGRYGTPVELEVSGQRCNAGSILELLVTVGSHPDAREFLFRGDEYPLRDIGLLFQHGLGENGMDRLPGELQYLRNG